MREGSLPPVTLHRGRHDGAELCRVGGPQVRGGGLAQVRSAAAKIRTEVGQETEEEEIEQGRVIQSSLCDLRPVAE